MPDHDQIVSKAARRISSGLSSYLRWSATQDFHRCRLVQYCGLDMVGAIDVLVDQIKEQIEGLLAEGFYVHWSCHEDCVYLKAWEFGGPEPDWKCVYEEKSLPKA